MGSMVVQGLQQRKRSGRHTRWSRITRSSGERNKVIKTFRKELL